MPLFEGHFYFYDTSDIYYHGILCYIVLVRIVILFIKKINKSEFVLRKPFRQIEFFSKVRFGFIRKRKRWYLRFSYWHTNQVF